MSFSTIWIYEEKIIPNSLSNRYIIIINIEDLSIIASPLKVDHRNKNYHD